jgi:micrococcal nuclease
MRYNFTSLTIITLFALIFVGADGGERFKYPAEDFSGDKTYRVLSVTDGDTLKIEYEGNSETIRLIGVDTPETVHPTKPVEPFGPEASAFTKNLLIGEEVYLRLGNEERGKYDRLLAYVYRAPDGLFVNLEIVRQGYGKAYVKYPFEHMALFQHYESRARSSGKGLWSGSSPVDEDTVYVTKSGTKYHRESCRWGNIAMPLSEARERYSPCARCAPPE